MSLGIHFTWKVTYILFLKSAQLLHYAALLNIIAPSGMNFFCIVLRYNKPNKPKNHSLLLSYNQTRTLILFLGF